MKNPQTTHSPRLLWLILGALCLSGCRDSVAPETPWLRIEPTQSYFSPGDVVTVTLRNAGTTPIDINTCFPQLERFDAGRWSAITFNRPNCGGIGLTLLAGGERVISLDILPHDFAAGTYRYRLSGAHLNDAHQTPLSPSGLLSAPFLVTGSVTIP